MKFLKEIQKVLLVIFTGEVYCDCGGRFEWNSYKECCNKCGKILK